MRRREFMTLVGGMGAYIRDGRLKAFGVASERVLLSLRTFLLFPKLIPEPEIA